MDFPEKNLFAEADSEYTDYRIPAMVISPRGVIYVAFECRMDTSDWANIDLRVMKSTDGGASFRQILKVPGQGKTLNNPVLLLDGEILHFVYCLEYRQVYHTVTEDEGDTWCTPREITQVFADLAHTVVATGPGHGIVTADGTFVLPVWLAYDPEDLHAHRPSFVTTLYSRDKGKTWSHGETLEAQDLVNANETAIVSLSNGSVLLNIRNRHPEKRARFLAVSPNGYDHWTCLGMDERFPDPWWMGRMCSGGGNVFFCNCESEEGRKNLTLKCSTDDFASFTKIPVCDVAGYSEIAWWDGCVYVLYESYLQGEERRYDHKLHLKKINVHGE